MIKRPNIQLIQNVNNQSVKKSRNGLTESSNENKKKRTLFLSRFNLWITRDVIKYNKNSKEISNHVTKIKNSNQVPFILVSHIGHRTRTFIAEETFKQDITTSLTVGQPCIRIA